ncbi:hypothetical protein O9H85_35525 [Paenibacillus filicis]|uniref:Uncharacterized protein n=1 Tax=Paenibacillus gyeongsangnamensis TaxID=3388067 RepID=A0ABT4QL11_9BACL|nr:hypothetical protein [Paenibacillus filicis]MCZ8517558.1 hypothetical protein [Paenibacillus filicis]
MLIDFFTLNTTTPVEEREHGISIGLIESYVTYSIIEAFVLINQIRRTVGNEPEGAFLSCKSFLYEFLPCVEAVCYYDPNNKDASEYAYLVGKNIPLFWDKRAKEELDMLTGVMGTIMNHRL